MNTNHPEKPFFDEIVALLRQREQIDEDVAQLYADAKEADGVGTKGVKVLRAAVKEHMLTDEKRAKRLALEDARDALLHRLGHLRGSPLGEAAMRAAE